MDWSEFKKNIDAGKIAKVYTFAGRERYLMEMALTALKAAVLSDGFEALNDTVLEAPSARQIIDAAETVPIMCDRRMLTVIDWRPATDGGAESDKDETALLETWIRNPPETCITVFYMKRELDGRRKAAMLLKQNSVFVQFDIPQPVQMFALMDARLAEYKKTITGEAREHLAVMMNHDMTAIMTELDKLVSYIGERKAIEKKDIDAITTPSLEYSIFVSRMICSITTWAVLRGSSTVSFRTARPVSACWLSSLISIAILHISVWRWMPVFRWTGCRRS